MELRAQGKVHEYWNHSFEAEVEVEEPVLKDGLEDLKDQVVHCNVARYLNLLLHQGLRFGFHILDEVRQEVHKEGLCGYLQQYLFHLRTEVRFKVLVYEGFYRQTFSFVTHLPL